MMENESLREPKNTTVMLLSIIVVALALCTIIAFVKMSGYRKDVERLTSEKEIMRQESEQLKQDTLRKMDEVEKLRQTAMEWTRQHQLQLQEEMRKKADEAAKQAQLKADAAKAPAKTAVKTTAKPTVKKTGAVKKNGSKKTTTKKTT